MTMTFDQSEAAQYQLLHDLRAHLVRTLDDVRQLGRLLSADGPRDHDAVAGYWRTIADQLERSAEHAAGEAPASDRRQALGAAWADAATDSERWSVLLSDHGAPLPASLSALLAGHDEVARLDIRDGADAWLYAWSAAQQRN